MWKLVLPFAKAFLENTNPADYHRLGADKKPGDPLKTMSRSELQKFGECPSRWYHGIPEKKTKAMTWGSVIDCLVIQPKLFDDYFAVAPAMYPCDPKKSDGAIEKPWNANSSWCKEWIADRAAEDREVIKHSEMAEATAAVERLGKHYKIPKVIAACRRSVMILLEWHDEDTGMIVPFKFLLDLLPNEKTEWQNDVIDFKTTNDASSRKWARRVFDDGLHYQAAMYLDAAVAATGRKFNQFSHIIQEKGAPFEPTMRPLSVEFLKYGKGHYIGDLKQYCRCLADDRWPGLDEAVVEPEPWMGKDL